MSLHPKTEISSSIIWAGVVTIGMILAFFGFLIAANRAADLQRMLVLLGQGAFSLVNLWAVYRTGKVISNKADDARTAARHTAQVTQNIQSVVEDVKNTVDGNTPPPGELRRIEPPGYTPEH